MKSMREINLDTYSLSLLTAKEDILNPRSSTNWALFAYDGIMNRLKLADSGGGLRELMTKLHPRRPLYGMCRVATNQSHIVMILWVGNEVDEYRKAECASHLPAIRSFFREVQIFLPAHTLEEITEERICTLASKAVMVMQGPRQRLSTQREDRQETVGTNYKRTIAAAEILRIQRDSFWAQAEREEDERKKEEQRRAAEDRRQREIERLHQEKREAVEREKKTIEREQKIKEQRRIQAQMEAEKHRQEGIKWKHQERERKEVETGAGYTRSESEEKAAEAASLVSQRAINPREFFRQLSASSLNSVSQPTSPNPGRSPYRRQHCSQTDNIFIFNEPSCFTPPSPYRSRVVSPYLPSTPTSPSPTLVFPNSSTSFSKQEGALVSSRSPVQASYDITAQSTSPSTLQFQTGPSPSVNAESEIKTPITAIIDSLVFYPPPPTREELQLDNQTKATDELPPPPSDFELSPKPSKELSEDSMQNQSDINLSSQRASDALTSPPPQSSPVSPSRFPVPQPPSRPLPALPVTQQTLNELEPQTDFTTRVSVISTVEEELEDETEKENGDRVEKIHEERVSDSGDEVKDGVRRCDGGDKREQNTGQEEADEMIMVKHIMEEIEDEDIQDGEKMKESETEKIKHGEIITECENEMDKQIIKGSESEKDEEEKIMEEHENEDDHDEKILEQTESEKCQEEKIIKQHGNENDQDEKIKEQHKKGKNQDNKNTEESESEKYEEVKLMGKSERETHEDEKNMEEHENEKDQEEKLMEKSERETHEDEKNMEEHENEKDQEEKLMEESERETPEDEKNMEEHENEKDQEEKLMEESERETPEDEKNMEEHENEKDREEKLMEESERETHEDEKILEEHENEKDQEEKLMEKSERETHEDEKILEEHENEKDQEEKIMEESESGKYQGETIEGHVNKKYQEEKIIKESESEIYPDETIMEESENEKDQDKKHMEQHENKKYQEEKIMEESESLKYEKETIIEQTESTNDEKSIENCDKDRKDKEDHQQNEERSNVDFNMSINSTVLKGESDTEILMANNATDEEVKMMMSDKQNEKEESNTAFMKTDEAVQAEIIEDDDSLNTDKHDVHEACAKTLFSQHAPVFPESSASTPDQDSHESPPENTANQNENQPQMSSTDDTSVISESHDIIRQSVGGEEPEDFIKGQDVAVDLDLSRCINDPTNESTDAEGEKKATSLKASNSNAFETAELEPRTPERS